MSSNVGGVSGSSCVQQSDQPKPEKKECKTAITSGFVFSEASKAGAGGSSPRSKRPLLLDIKTNSTEDKALSSSMAAKNRENVKLQLRDRGIIDEIIPGISICGLEARKKADPETYGVVISLISREECGSIAILEHQETHFLENFEDLPMEEEFVLENVSRLFQVVEDALKNGKNVLVHCLAGHSRAPGFVAAYLIKFKSRDFDPFHAIQTVCLKRPTCCPHQDIIRAVMPAGHQFTNEMYDQAVEAANRTLDKKERVATVSLIPIPLTPKAGPAVISPISPTTLVTGFTPADFPFA